MERCPWYISKNTPVSTNSKSIHWFWWRATGGPEASPWAQPSYTPWDRPFLANTGYTGLSSACSLKIKRFFKVSLVGPIWQPLAAKSFTSKLKFWMLQWCTPVLDWRSPISAAEPHIHTSNRQSLLSSHHLTPCPLPWSTAAHSVFHTSTEATVMPLLWPHHIMPGSQTVLTPTWHLRPPGTRSQQHHKTRQGTTGPSTGAIWPSCPRQPWHGCMSHCVSGFLGPAAQSCLCAYRQNRG